MVYVLIAIAPVLLTTLLGRVTHRPFASAGIVSAMTLVFVIGLASIASQNGVGVSVALLGLLTAWAIATSFAEALRLRRSPQARVI